MEDPKQDQPAPELPDSLATLSEDGRQKLFDVQAELSQDIVGVRETGQVVPEAIPELENKQWTFERSEVAQDIQRTNDIQGPGE